MKRSYKCGGSDPVPGSSQALEDLSPAELAAFPAPQQAISWARTWYPVEMQDFRTMSTEAAKPEPSPQKAFADEAGDEDIDVVAVADTQEEDVGEEELFAAEAQPQGALAPSRVANFPGIPATGWQPPDNAIGVGAKHVVLAVNVDLAGYDKAGQLIFRWTNMTSLFQSVLPSGANLFDPRVIYDHYAGRWLVIVDARRNSPRGSWIMVAASQSANPAGPYWVWALDATLDGSTPTNNWADYTTVGIDTQGLYMSNNMFAFDGGFQYSKLRILQKAELYGGGTGASHTIRWYDFWNLKNPDKSMAFTLQPCMHFRGRGGNPPAYLVNALWPGGASLTFWTLSDPVGFWSGRTPSLSSKAVKCRQYSLPPDAIQKNSNTRLETNDSRLLNAIYQHVGGKRSVWTAHTSRITWAGDTEARSCLQWYEIDVASKSVVQQNAYGARGRYYFFPAIQTDIARNAYLVFTRSSASEFGSLRYTGRRASAPPNDLENSALIKAGESVYSGGRWGDYFGVARDGDDSRRVWCYGEYAEARGRWGTWAAELGY